MGKWIFRAAPKSFPRGEGAPVRTLGRMRNGDISNLQMQLVKMVKPKDYSHLSQVHLSLLLVAVPHPSRLRRSTFPQGEGFFHHIRLIYKGLSAFCSLLT